VERINRLLSIKGKQTATDFHKKLGKIMWDHCGMTRTEAGLTEALKLIRELREEFWKDLLVPGLLMNLTRNLRRQAGWLTSWNWGN
jgi:succinate dehydrogenase / fumarate reductase, flavoprotein subunit